MPDHDHEGDCTLDCPRVKWLQQQPPAGSEQAACVCPADICLGEDPTATKFCRPCHDLDAEMPCLADPPA